SDQQHTAYERYSVPESRHVGRASLSGDSHIDYSKTRAPLLITAGSQDHIIPPALNRSNFGKYKGAANVALKEFSGRPHFLIGDSGWQEVADYTLAWLKEKGITA